jgi:transcriptional regulator with XRE-family HTH domain
MRGKALTAAQNEHLRVLFQKLLERLTQKELGDALGLSQGGISVFLQGGHGTSLKVAKKVADLMGRSLDDVLVLRDPDAPDRYPNRVKAVEIARQLGEAEYRAEAVDFVATLDRWGNDLPVKTWLRMIDFWDEQIRLGQLLPLGPQGRPR